MGGIKEKEHRIKVDHATLLEFFQTPTDKITEHQKNEVDKVLNIVLIKHFSKHKNIFLDLRSFAWVAILERHKKQEFAGGKGSAYNYIYTTFRNEVGNKQIKFFRETPMEDINSFRSGMYDTTEDDLPEEIKRYTKFLTGEESYTFIRIPRKDVLPLLIFVRMFEVKRAVAVPNFITVSKKSIQVMYKLLKETFGETED